LQPAPTITALALLATPAASQSAGIPDDHFARDLANLRPELRETVASIQTTLGTMGTSLRLVAMIPELEHRSGCFHDFDGDGDLDFVSTERVHGLEDVQVHRNDERGWRRTGRSGRGIQQKHPLDAWVLTDAGSGTPAVVLPVGWPPHLFLLRMDRSGRFVGDPQPLGEHLPPRLSSPAGVDNCPYTILDCAAAGPGRPARIRGRMDDQAEHGARATVEFTIELDRDSRVRTSFRAVEDRQPELGEIPTAIAAVPSPARCEHESDERRAILGTELRDIDRDGTLDLVLFSGVLSTHIFPGQPGDGRLSFAAERGRARDLPIEDLRMWLPIAARPAAPGDPFAWAARDALERIGFRIEQPGIGEAEFVVWTERRKGWLLNYYAVADGLVPVQDYRTAWPATASGRNHLSESHRQVLLLDADHDGGLDVLSVHVGEEFVWLKPPPAGGGFVSAEHTRKIRPGVERAGIVHGLGERHDAANRVLAYFDDRVELPRSPNGGYPISVEEVPVRGPGGVRTRFCVYLRWKKVGLFFEIAPPPARTGDRRTRRLAGWVRRAERRAEMRHFHWACDARTCSITGTHHREVDLDAADLWARALDLADSDADRGWLHWRIARSASRAGDLDRARSAYQSFVELSGRIEALDDAHPDLAALFTDPRFRAAHRGWAESASVVRPEELVLESR
jgi:hypothetical protein